MTARLLAALIVLCLAGCAASVDVDHAFPPPLIAPLPLRMALYYPPELGGFVHREEIRGDQEWTVRLGAANVRMFDALLPHLFETTQQVSSVAAAAQEMPGLSGILSPSIDTFEFSLPEQAATDQHAVWIRYTLAIYGADGQLIVRWPISAYGQSGTEGLSREESMELAVVRAMRDAAATIAVQFARQPKVREQLLHEPPAGNP
jgi:hypothetical protein